MSLLTIRDLTVEYPTRFGTVTAIRGVNLDLKPGEIHGLVGESGAGKSTVGAAVMGLIQSPGRIASGSIRLNDQELTGLDPDAWRKFRGAEISMIFQDPLTSLDPLFTIGDQLVETIRHHSGLGETAARDRARELLEAVGIDRPVERLGHYPHEFSGGMRQRVVIALAISTDPAVIIADEPTTALDVSVQSQILDLIRGLARDRQIGVIFVTHDIGVIGEITDKVSVMFKGEVVETGLTELVLGAPDEPYTQKLMAAVPRLGRKLKRFPVTDDGAEDGGDFAEQWLLRELGTPLAETSDTAALDLDGVSVTYTGGGLFARRPFKAVDAVSFAIRPGEVMGLVGESGSGKSTIARAIVGLVDPSDGTIRYRGRDLSRGKAPDARALRREVQMIFQDPYSSLNNRWRIGDIVAEPLRVYRLAERTERRKIVASVLDLVGVGRGVINRYPHQFSGGQRQRIAVARALVARPRLLVCDEPTSALDVSIQAQVLNLLKDLQDRLGLTMLFISHNLPVVRQMADRVVVLRNGRVEEASDAESFFAGPGSDYGRDLLAETPSLDLLGPAVLQCSDRDI